MKLFGWVGLVGLGSVRGYEPQWHIRQSHLPSDARLVVNIIRNIHLNKDNNFNLTAVLAKIASGFALA